jgi:hypothetical protein
MATYFALVLPVIGDSMRLWFTSTPPLFCAQHRLLSQHGVPKEQSLQTQPCWLQDIHVRSNGRAAGIALALAAALPSPQGHVLVDDRMFMLLLPPSQVRTQHATGV